jgi:medium-chain acyl-[acyl-carrier-protein] hydrolase
VHRYHARWSRGVSDPWLQRHPARGEQLIELVCFSYAGGGAWVYREWPGLLPDWVTLTAIQLPGRGSRLSEAPIADAHRLADAVADRLDDRRPGEVALFGYSLGALLAFETTRRLQARDAGPIRLFVAARSAPHLPRRSPPISRLPDPDFVAAIRALNGTPDAVLASDELMELVLPSLRADFQLSEDYRLQPGPPVRVPIVAIGGTGDPLVSRDDVAAWRRHTSDGLTVHAVPGDHFFLHTDPSALTRIVSQELTAALAVPPTG